MLSVFRDDDGISLFNIIEREKKICTVYYNPTQKVADEPHKFTSNSILLVTFTSKYVHTK